MNIDVEAAAESWPNFRKFFDRFKDHPALGPGAVEESGEGPSSSGLAETEQEDIGTPDSSRPLSRAAVESVGDSKEEEEEVDDGLPARKKSKKTETPLVARVGKKKEKGTASA